MLKEYRAAWREMLTASRPDETLYLWTLIAIGHVFVGAIAISAVAEIFGPPDPAVPVILAALYLVLKEILIDLRQPGASAVDGLADAVFVAIGLSALGWAPERFFLVAGGAVFALGLLRSARKAL